MFFINIESGKIYTIIGTEVLPDTTPVKLLRRVGDGYSPRVNELAFALKYRVATPEETTVITGVERELNQTGRDRSIYELTNTQPPARRRRPDPTLGPEGQVADAALADTQRNNESLVGTLVEPTEKDTFDQLILHKETIDSVHTGLNMIKKAEDIDRIFGIHAIEQVQGRCILNFYGAPGTGKTAAARCIAKELDKKLFQVDYSQMISKYVGDTAKHIKEAFMEAQKHNAILFWDEADAMMSKRVSMGDAGEANSINQNRNVLMQEMDKFKGIMITTTNFFGNFDEAILRRVAQHIEFQLPTYEMRFKILQNHFPLKDRVVVDFEKLAARTDGFSGGDILNLCKNSMYAAANSSDDTNKWTITDDLVLQEAEKIKSGKESHKKGGPGTGKYNKGKTWI